MGFTLTEHAAMLHHQKQELARLAAEAMRERGLRPEFSADALRQLERIDGPRDEAAWRRGAGVSCAAVRPRFLLSLGDPGLTSAVLISPP